MWLYGLLFFMILVIAKCSEAELTMEAAFQGRCGRNSPCEQLCYEIHDGMYECDCTTGFELNENGYSCQEINSTFQRGLADELKAIDEDVLYQRGVSFSAKLDNHLDSEEYSDENFYRDLTPDGKSDVYLTELKNNFSVPELNNNERKPNYISENKLSIITNTNSSQHNIQPVDVNSLVKSSYQEMNLSSNRNIDYNKLNLSHKSETYQASTMHISTNVSFDNESQKQQNIQSLSVLSATDPLNATTITSCQLTCGPEGDCENTNNNEATQCLCPLGKSGNQCSQNVKVQTPRFNKKSWLSFQALKGAYKHVQLRIEFRPESDDGILLLTGERDDLTGDFMALLSYKGYIEFWFDCGSGIGIVRSKEKINLNQWNSITLYRHRWDAWLVLNHGERVQGRSKGLFSRITFREPVFLGGIGNITGLSQRLPVNQGFSGCIRRFIANEHEYHFSEYPAGDISKGFGIHECISDKCGEHLCENGGECISIDKNAVCLCPLGFSGNLCQTRLDLQVPSFNGSSYLRYKPIGESGLIWLELLVVIKPHQLNGIILYSGREINDDYICLSLNDGYVEFIFNLGSGAASVKSTSPITPDTWHIIRISRTARLAVLKVDNLSEVMTISPSGFWHLSLPHALYLAGVHDAEELPMDVRARGSFVGCVQKIQINGHDIGVVSEALGGVNVESCPHACMNNPCGFLSKCTPVLQSYKCECIQSDSNCNITNVSKLNNKTQDTEMQKSKSVINEKHKNKKYQKTQTHHSFKIKKSHNSSKNTLEHRNAHHDKIFARTQVFYDLDSLATKDILTNAGGIFKEPLNKKQNDLVRYTEIDQTTIATNKKTSSSVEEENNSLFGIQINNNFDLPSALDENFYKHKYLKQTSNSKKRDIGACFSGTDSYFQYNDADTLNNIFNKNFDFNLRIKTYSNFGVILWTGRQRRRINDEYFSLGIEDGFLHFRIKLGSKDFNIQVNTTKISDGLWHRIRATKYPHGVILEVDGRKVAAQKLTWNQHSHFRPDSVLFVGGLPQAIYYTRRRYISGIIGCISEIVLAGVELNLDPTIGKLAHNVKLGLL